MASDDRLIALIGQVEIFKGLSPSELRAVAALIRVRRYQRRQVIVADQDSSTDLMMILEGQVSVSVIGEDGREVSFRQLEAGSSFGELAAIDLQPRSASVMAIKPTTIGTMSGTDYRAALRRYQSVVDATLLKLVGYVRSLSKKIADLSYTVTIRVCFELESMARNAGATSGRVVIRPVPRRIEIASRNNTTREQVSRALTILQKEGLIIKGRGELVIPDLGKLVAWRRKERAAR